MLTVNAFPLRQQHADINALVPQPASNDLNQKGVTVGLTDRYQFSSGAIFSTIAQYTRFDGNAHGQGPADMLITPEGWAGTSSTNGRAGARNFKWFPRTNLPRNTGLAATSSTWARIRSPLLRGSQQFRIRCKSFVRMGPWRKGLIFCGDGPERVGHGRRRVYPGSLGYEFPLGRRSGSTVIE